MKIKTFLLAFLVLLLGLVACTPAAVDEGGAETAVPPTETPTIPPTDTPSEQPTDTPTEQPTETPSNLTEETVRNMSYQGIYEEPVTLTDGLYEGEPFVEGGASKPTVALIPVTAFGDLNGDGVDDAAVLLVESSGGSGSFVYLAVVINNEGVPENVATTLVGDRVSPESLTIDAGEIVLEAASHAESDPMCCPSLKTRTTYAFETNVLTLVNVDDLTESAVPSELQGIWYWLAYQDTAELNDITVPDPSKYTLELLADGMVQIQADCNSASSTATIEGSSLTFSPGPMTLVECEPGSLYSQYLAKLGDVVSYVFDEDGNLVLNLKMDAGNMIFGRTVPAADSTSATDAPSIQLDTSGVSPSWSWSAMPETPYDQSMPPGPVGLPAHIEILFDDTEVGEHQPGGPILFLIPVKAYQQMWEAAGNTAVSDVLTQIADRTYVTNAPGGMAALPFEEIVGFNDLAVQIGRPIPSGQLNETSAAQSGYRFVGRWAQDANPVTNQGLTYIYQGFTNDGRYLVSFFYPISTTALPSIEEVPQEEFDRLTNDYDAYMAEKTDLLNGLDNADFTPNLAELDALVASLEIEGMPVSGLLDKTWQWVSGPSEPGSDEIISIESPELYQVTYGSDGTIEIVADCNQARMSYELNQGGLVGGMLVMPGPMTLAECGPESHYLSFISSLEAAQDYRVLPGGDQMELILPAGGGTLSFQAAP